MSEATAIAWALVGLIGGYRLNKTEKLDGILAWGMAALLGPVTLFLSIWERPL